MKLLYTFKREYLIEEDEAENISEAFNKGYTGLIKLRNGTMVNISSISEITDIPKVKIYKGFLVSQNEWFYRDGVKIHIEHPELIEEIEDPKYTSKILKLKSGK